MRLIGAQHSEKGSYQPSGLRSMKWLTCFLLLAAACTATAQDLSKVNFRLRDIDGKDQSFQQLLASIRGDDATPRKGVLIISFWALWCVPCQQEMKALKPVYEKYKDRNVHYLAINTDQTKSFSKVKAWVAGNSLPYHFWLDPNSEVFKKLNGQNMPYQLIIDAQGKLIAKRTGFLAGEEKEIEQTIATYLEKP
jgi:thiol-disulfide isomerase/thioredoxin